MQIAGHWAQMVYSANREREEDWFCSQVSTSILRWALDKKVG